MGKRVLVIQCAALGRNLFQGDSPHLADLPLHDLPSTLPGLTCPAQASFRCAAPPSEHGMVANGLYHRSLRKPLFWEQASAQVQGPRIWESYQQAGHQVGMLFWQQSLGESADVILSPRPIHKHGGGMIQACYSKPADLHPALCDAVGRNFNLMHYWGPLASRKSSAWIVESTSALLQRPDCPDLLFTYLPHLDYDTQRFGISHAKSATALQELEQFLRTLIQAASEQDMEVLLWGDYAMHNRSGPALFPNRALREAGLLGIQNVKGMAYPDLFDARAFAMVDHEIAHVYIPDPADIPAAREALEPLEGLNAVLSREELPELNHANSGELILMSEPGRLMAYPWWTDPGEAPDFATHVDIHNKPGFDPCELFFGRFPWQVSLDTERVGGCHGASGPGSETVWACSDPNLITETPESLPALAKQLQISLDRT